MAERVDPLVGRDHELAVLGRLLDDTCRGAARFVAIVGEPGIGKTRLLADLRLRADERGCLALGGSAAEFERALPFGLVVDAFDDYLSSLDPETIDRLDADGMDVLAAVFPSLRALGSKTDHPVAASERYRAYYAFRELLERLAARQPVVVTLDDLHWADSATLELARYLVRRPPQAAVMVAASFRIGQAEPAMVGVIDAATRAGLMETIVVGPLQPQDADELLLGARPSERERIYAESGGNPFYLLQLARSPVGISTSAAGSAGSAATTPGVPASVVAAITSELSRLSAPARRLVEAAAIAGDPFEFDLAMDVAEMPDRYALDALDALTASGLIRPSEVPRRFQFRHPLVRNALYQACSPGSRLLLHERAATALAARGAPASTRAHHVEQSARHGDEDAIAVLRDAGDTTAQKAPDIAARWYSAALRLVPATSVMDRVSLLMALAGALGATGQFAEARAALLDALSAVPADQTALRVGLTTACAGMEQLLGRHQQAHGRLRSALVELPDQHSVEAAVLMMGLASDSLYHMDYEAMRSWGQRAVDAASGLGDRPLLVAATSVLALADAFAGAIESAEANCSLAAALVDTMPDDELAGRLDAVAHLSGAELYLDRFAQATAHAMRGVTLARATSHGDLFPMFVPSLGSSLYMQGRLGEAATLLDDGVEGARLAGNVQSLAWNLLNRAFVELLSGDLPRALKTAEESVDLARGIDLGSLVPTYAGGVLALTLFEAGEPARALDTLLDAAGGPDVPLMPGGWRAYFLDLMTRCLVALGRRDEAVAAAERASAWAAALGLPMATGVAERAAAAVAFDVGDWRTAADRALASAAALDAVGARVEASRSRIMAGRAMVQSGDLVFAEAELQRAAVDLDACGALRYRAEAEQELRRLGRRVHRRGERGSGEVSGIAALSERELEVARLVVDRRTNPEIAAELFLGLKTVETHMRNIFRKLGVSSRVEVARAIERAAAV